MSQMLMHNSQEDLLWGNKIRNNGISLFLLSKRNHFMVDMAFKCLGVFVCPKGVRFLVKYEGTITSEKYIKIL